MGGGDELRELMVVPAVAVNVSPRIAIVPLSAATKTVEVRVELLNNMESGGTGQLAHRELGRPLQQELQGYVVFLHESRPL